MRSSHKLRTRKAGAARFVDLHPVVNAQMTVSDSHSIADRIMTDFRTHFPHIGVILHIEPCDGSCSSACKSGCLLGEDERSKAVATKASK